MKYLITLLGLILFNKISNGQTSIDSVCKICDSSAIRFCGDQNVNYVKLYKNKVKEDIKVIKNVQIFLKSKKDTVFKIKLKPDSKNYQDDRSKLLKTEIFYLNYVKLTLYVYFNGKEIIKSATVTKNGTVFCKLNGFEPGELDSRISKKIVGVLKIKYVYYCGIIFLNNFNTYTSGRYEEKLRDPNKIEKIIIEVFPNY